MRIAVGSDHAGYEDPPPYYKPEIVEYLMSLGIDVVDCGTDSAASVDYPDFARKVCASVLCGAAECGILICGTGMGIGMAANRYPGIRAAVCATPDMVFLARDHNDANVLCLGKRVLTLDQCKAFVDLWLKTPFGGGERHQRRIAKLG